MKSLIVVYSYHHHNTRKVAEVIAPVIGADVKSPLELSGDNLKGYELLGFGSGIDSGMHYKELLAFAEKLSPVDGKRCFIFSTSAIQGDEKVANDHMQLREILRLKGYNIVGEFSCKGFNTNSFLKFLGGMNRNRPNAEDLKNAEKFALKLNAIER